MNIWIFNHYAVGPHSNGITRHFDLAKYLVKRGHRVTIFASSFNHQALKEEHFNNSPHEIIEKQYDGVKFVWMKTFPYERNNWRRVVNMVSYTKKAYEYGKKMNETPHIVIGSLAHPLAALVGERVAKKKKALFYFEERDLWPQSLIDLGKMSEKNPAIIVLSSLEKYLYKRARRIILLFDKAVNYVAGRGISRDKVIYIPNGVDFARLDVDVQLPAHIQQTFNELKGKTIAIYTGTLGLANSTGIILDTAKELQTKNRNIHFLFVGGGPEKEMLIKRKEDEQLHNVTFIDPVPKKYIFPILKQSHIGLLPLKDSPVFKWGISPNKLYDYMAASLPVALLCNLDDTPIEKEKAGIVIKRNFRDELTQFLTNVETDTLKTMGENGFRYVTEHHSWENLAKSLEKTMEKDLKRYEH